jgi:hypothetical protein
MLMGTFTALAGAFARWFVKTERQLPERMGMRDLALLTVASHKSARLISRDRVTSAVRAPFTEFEHDAGPGEVSDHLLRLRAAPGVLSTDGRVMRSRHGG